ncbi:MAG: hypothetical protein FWD05_04500 [Oscillospiraceae bacterium]|nr:hypothetical protein [Oscillospiraceae bacterium]
MQRNMRTTAQISNDISSVQTNLVSARSELQRLEADLVTLNTLSGHCNKYCESFDEEIHLQRSEINGLSALSQNSVIIGRHIDVMSDALTGATYCSVSRELDELLAEISRERTSLENAIDIERSNIANMEARLTNLRWELNQAMSMERM